MLQHIIVILSLGALCAGWVALQFLARKLKTKNHFDDIDADTCGSCTCGGGDNICATKH